MIAKLAVLFFASACLAFPAEEVPSPPANTAEPAPVPVPPQPVPSNQAVPVPIPEGYQSEGLVHDGPVPAQVPEGGKPENSDLKTDNSFWYRKSYYPVYYSRSYYTRPRAYTYSYYPTYYSWKSWNPYYWW